MNTPLSTVDRRLSTPRLLIPILSLLALSPCGCHGPTIQADPAREIPSSVLVRAAPSGTAPAVPPPLDPRLLAARIADGLRAGAVFSEVRGTATGPSRGEEADASPPDYICEVEVKGKGFRPEDSSATSRAILSTFLWWCAVFPAWWIDDRMYPGCDVEVRARFYPAGPGRTSRPVLAEAVPPDGIELDLLRRGATWQFFLSIVVPPFWMDDPGEAEKALEAEAVSRARREIAGMVRKDWPAAALLGDSGCFLVLDPDFHPVEVSGGKASIAGWILARSPLKEVRVSADDGRVLRTLRGNGLKDLAVSLDGSREEDRRAGRVIRERLGAGTPLPRAVVRLSLDGLEVGRSERVRIAAQLASDAPPGGFTVPIARPK